MAIELQISETQVNDRLTRVKQKLQDRLKNYVQNISDISLSSLSSADKRIAVFVEEWLKNAPYSILEEEIS